VNRREIPDIPLVAMRARNRRFAGKLWPMPVPHALLAMQKVEGSNPFSRSPDQALWSLKRRRLPGGRHRLRGLRAFVLAVNRAISGEQLGDADHLRTEH